MLSTVKAKPERSSERLSSKTSECVPERAFPGEAIFQAHLKFEPVGRTRHISHTKISTSLKKPAKTSKFLKHMTTRIFISTEKKIRRSLATQRRIRTTVNKIHNLVYNLVEILLPRTDPISQEDSERLGRIGAVLIAINENQGHIASEDLNRFLERQTQELQKFLSDTCSWHTCSSGNESA